MVSSGRRRSVEEERGKVRGTEEAEVRWERANVDLITEGYLSRSSGRPKLSKIEGVVSVDVTRLNRSALAPRRALVTCTFFP